jgi:hypothetical protein
MTYNLTLVVGDGAIERDESQILYYLSKFLCGGRKLVIHYDGSSDEGDIDEVLLDNTPVGVLPLKGVGDAYRINSDIVGWIIIEMICSHTGTFISFDNEGSRGRIEVSEEEGRLVISYSHVYRGEQHCFITECDCTQAPTHGLVKKYKELKDGKAVHLEEHEELCGLLGLLGVKALSVQKDGYEDSALIVLDISDDDEALEHDVEKLTTSYFNHVTNYSENTSFSLSFQSKDGGYFMEMDVFWKDRDSEEETGVLIVDFVLETAFDQKEGW